MKKCDQCQASLVFGGVDEGVYKFCNERCRDRYIDAVADTELPEEFIYEKALALMAGICPNCGGEGPVAVHTSHWVLSYLVGTSYQAVPAVSCSRCGKIEKVKALAFCSVLGWWGPLGLIVTPFQILRNIFDPVKPATDEPSAEFLALARKDLAKRLMAEPASEREPDGT